MHASRDLPQQIPVSQAKIRIQKPQDREKILGANPRECAGDCYGKNW